MECKVIHIEYNDVLAVIDCSFHLMKCLNQQYFEPPVTTVLNDRKKFCGVNCFRMVLHL